MTVPMVVINDARSKGHPETQVILTSFSSPMSPLDQFATSFPALDFLREGEDVNTWSCQDRSDPTLSQCIRNVYTLLY